ncbi:MAG: hypothetical protein LBR15_08260 [Methanobrevibacter sp.]|jgi:hypothetical protein|nr:hypothetical protein [Candidatus Methanovirga australis]
MNFIKNCRKYVFDLVQNEGLSYQEIRIHKSNYPILEVISNDKILEWVNQAKNELE